MSKHIHKKSYIAEYGIKVLMIVYLASVFFYQETLDPSNNLDSEFSLLFIIKLIILLSFSIVILAVEERIFKVLGFTTVIIGALYKIIILISQDNFAFHQLLSLGDSIMLIGVSSYYLYRHKLKVKTYEKKRREKKLKKTLTKDNLPV